MAFLLGEVRRPRYMFAYQFDLSSISRVTPDAGPTAMQQVGQYLAVMHVGRRRSHRADECALAVHPDVRLHAKIPLAAFVRSMHIRLSLPVLVLRRNRSVDIDGIRDGAGIHLHPILMRILGDQGKQPVPKVGPFQTVVKLTDRLLTRNSYNASSTTGYSRLNQCHKSKFVTYAQHLSASSPRFPLR